MHTYKSIEDIVGEIVRFAPSPTGHLHIGGARTAIFNWLVAKKTGGKFLLRIEDTDLQRSTQESINQIIESMRWLGLDWDEPVFYQSENRNRHIEVAQNLLQEGKAYRCFCSKEELTEKRAKAEKETGGYQYDGKCRKLSGAEIANNLDKKLPFTLRLMTKHKDIRFTDLVIGETKITAGEIDDIIILRSDGSPVYQLAVVVDDFDMGITTVLRGSDHLMNTFKQILIYEAMGWTSPQFGHVPLIMGVDKKRLSKRHGATSVEEFKDQGILAEALFNYLCLLGWSPGDDMELMDRNEIIKKFDQKKINKSAAVFDPKKLNWFNSKYIAQLSIEEILPEIEAYFDTLGCKIIDSDKERFKLLVGLYKIRSGTLAELKENLTVYFFDPEVFTEKGVNKFFTEKRNMELLRQISGKVASTPNDPFSSIGNSEIFIRSFAEEQNTSAAKVIHPLRLAISGKTESPGIFELVYILGREKIIRRIDKALTFI
ncbi:MAG TPA: glutamate--tRNA ligase, partial [Caldithrix sp.]|nr:glutamate--tRNA ligase [Caldithrix sp.]